MAVNYEESKEVLSTLSQVFKLGEDVDIVKRIHTIQGKICQHLMEEQMKIKDLVREYTSLVSDAEELAKRPEPESVHKERMLHLANEQQMLTESIQALRKEGKDLTQSYEALEVEKENAICQTEAAKDKVARLKPSVE